MSAQFPFCCGCHFLKYKHKKTNRIQAWLLPYLLKSPSSMGWVGTWRQHFGSGRGCLHPHWMGMFHWGWHRWWRQHSTCLESGCSPCSSAPQAPGRPAYPPLSAWKTSHQWSEQTRNRRVLPVKQQWVLLSPKSLRLEADSPFNLTVVQQIASIISPQPPFPTTDTIMSSCQRQC